MGLGGTAGLGFDMSRHEHVIQRLPEVAPARLIFRCEARISGLGRFCVGQLCIVKAWFPVRGVEEPSAPQTVVYSS